MVNAPHFKYYLEGLDKPEPMFGLWMPNSNGFSDVSGETVLAAGKPLPLFPDYKTWRNEVSGKRRCGRCWRVTRGADDLLRHTQISHMSAPVHMPTKEVA